MVADGAIRRFGANLDLWKLGFSGAVAVSHVMSDDVERMVVMVARHQGNTRRHLRDRWFNIWFAIIASVAGRIQATPR